MNESYPVPVDTSKETSNDSSPESSKDSSKSKKKKSFELGKAAAPAIIEAPKEVQQSEYVRSLFQKRAESESDKLLRMVSLEPEKNAARLAPGLEAKTSSQAAESTDIESRTAETKDYKKSPEAGEAEAPLELLSVAESHEAALQFTQAQKEVLPASTEGETDEAMAAENAVDVAFLETFEAELAENPEMSVAEAVDKAETTVAELIEAASEAATEIAEEDLNEVVQETVSAIPEGEVRLSGSVPEEETVIIHPTSPAGTPTPAGGSGGSGGGIPPRSGIGAGTTGSGGGTGSSGSSRGGGGGSPPFGAGGSYGTAGTPGYAGTGPNFNTMPGSSQIIEVQDITAERRAMAQGVLVGGLVGYLIGRRRGRIKTEKRLLPIQKKLEKQVSELHDRIAFREQAVRKLAREKSEALAASTAAQTRFTKRLAAPSLAKATVEGRQTTISQNLESTAISGTLSSRENQEHLSRSDRFASGIIEAPAILFGAAAAIRPERHKEVAPAVDFTKKIEAYSTQELTRAAEKIRIDGTSLKELANSHNLDEKALRRVVAEFVSGGNVKEALTRELVQKELQFERDPIMRQSGQSGTGSGQARGGTAGVTDSEFSRSGNNAPNDDGNSTKYSMSRGNKPTPSKATIDTLRKQQITQISIAGGIVVIFAAIIVVLVA